ncbi:MAG: 4-hydroxy-tetrahydrodipicolinate reductase, partial [Planctomycetota bacterium]|nr:4-hydroxy-tetrahydrodipicolinate reductase [Planctomycetota bacterium]
MIRLAVYGAAGRMGARICTLARDDPRFDLVAQIDPAIDLTTTRTADVSPDVIIDFSSDEGTRSATRFAIEHRLAILVGTTGLSSQTLRAIDVAAGSVPAMVAANTSFGVAVLTHLVTQAARLLGDGYDVNLTEVHHAGKRDKPSGTALRIAERLRRDAGIELPADRIHAIRGGDVVGEHTVEFAADGERIRLCHIATSRDLFARGALRAAAWLHGQA